MKTWYKFPQSHEFNYHLKGFNCHSHLELRLHLWEKSQIFSSLLLVYFSHYFKGQQEPKSKKEINRF